MADFENDFNEWKEVIKGIKRLKNNKKIRSELKPLPQIIPNIFNHHKFHAPRQANLKELIIDSHEGVDTKTFKKITKGKYTVSAVLDLHGLNQEQAFSSLQNFIQSSFQNHKRLLLIIVGKGNKSSNNGGVLRKSIPHWINNLELRKFIISITTASSKHGGGGAFYILLKKNKI